MHKIALILIINMLFFGSLWAQDDLTFSEEEVAKPQPKKKNTGSKSKNQASSPTKQKNQPKPQEEDLGGGEDLVFDTPVDEKTPLPLDQGGSKPSFLKNNNVEAQPQVTEAQLAALQKADYEKIWVLQRRPFLKKGRVDVSPMFGSNFNDPLVNFYSIGGDVNYHLNEDMAVGLRGYYTLNTETADFDRMIQQYSLFPLISRPIWSTTLNFQYAPLYGKFAFFDSFIIPWELYTRAGVGWVQTFIAGRVMLTAGAGQRFFLNRFMTLNLDIDYQAFQEEFQTTAGTESRILNNMMFNVGMSIYFPFDFEYKELR
jgi:outer membrane beta-barrel protein